MEYQELRGAMMECDVEVVREGVADFGTALFERYAPGVDVGEMISQQAPEARRAASSPPRAS